MLLLAEYTRGAKQVMKAKFVCNIHNVVIFSIATTVIRLNTTSTSIMTPKMNNNDRKNLSKTIAMAGMGFLLIAAGFTFSFANSGQQSVYAQQGGNATTTMGATPIDTFTASGPITATIQEQGGGNQTAGGGNQTAGGGGGGGQEPPYILGGDWNIDVQDGNVTGFTANFLMVHTDGTGYHSHDITNFSIGNNTVALTLGQESSINGTADISVNGTNQWPGVDTTLTFTPTATVLTINPESEGTSNHFQGQPIYGIVQQATGENDTTIVQAPGQEQEDGGPLGGLLGGDEQQQQGNQTGDGGPLAPLTEPFQDLFGGEGGQ